MKTLDTIRRVLWTMAGPDVRQQEAQLASRAAVEALFALHLLTGLHGLPALPPGSDLALLPHAVPSVMAWRRRTLLATDVSEQAGRSGC